MQPNIQQNMQPNMQQNMQYNMQQNMQQNMQYNLQPNMQPNPNMINMQQRGVNQNIGSGNMNTTPQRPNQVVTPKGPTEFPSFPSVPTKTNTYNFPQFPNFSYPDTSVNNSNSANLQLDPEYSNPFSNDSIAPSFPSVPVNDHQSQTDTGNDLQFPSVPNEPNSSGTHGNQDTDLDFDEAALNARFEALKKKNNF